MAESGWVAAKAWWGKATADKLHVWNGTANWNKKYRLEKGTKRATFNKQTDLETRVQTANGLYFFAIARQKPQKCYEPGYARKDING